MGFFGYEHDRKLAVQALAVSAAKNDVHAVFAGLVFTHLISSVSKTRCFQSRFDDISRLAHSLLKRGDILT